MPSGWGMRANNYDYDCLGLLGSDRVNAGKISLVGSANKTTAALVAGVRYSYSEQPVNRFAHWALATKTIYELC